MRYNEIMKRRIIALAAVLLILPGTRRVCDAVPPSGSPWKMTFNDEFQRQDLSLAKWTAKGRSFGPSPGRSQSEVLRDNVRIKNGVCRLLTIRGGDGKRWMTAQFFSTAFRQRYGYYEVRMKIGGTTGLTNVFALISHKEPNVRLRFYIDVAHTRYPNRHRTRVGITGGREVYPDRWRTTAEDLSKDYHLYGLEWTDSKLIWYFDGREIRRLSHTLLRHPARVQLVTWVGEYGGRLTDVLEVTSMEVDYVRVYQKLDRPPNWSEWQDGIQ